MSISLNEYEAICDLAVRMAKVTTRENIISGDTWKPFTLLYGLIEELYDEDAKSISLQFKINNQL